jgi:mRNA-degrading endonuclease RelE of RelBE toxin-antitoxin system
MPSICAYPLCSLPTGLDFFVIEGQNGAMVRLTATAREQLQQLPKSIRARIYDLLQRLEKWPDVSGAKPLRGNLAGRYRLRNGDFRLQFRVVNHVVIIEEIGHRDKFYE